jgi:hypothetical protein
MSVSNRWSMPARLRSRVFAVRSRATWVGDGDGTAGGEHDDGGTDGKWTGQGDPSRKSPE